MVLQVVVGRKLDDVFMVMEFMEHDLKGLMEDRDSSNPLFAMSEVMFHPAVKCFEPVLRATAGLLHCCCIHTLLKRPVFSLHSSITAMCAHTVFGHLHLQWSQI